MYENNLILIINTNNNGLISWIITFPSKCVRGLFCSSLYAGSNRTLSSIPPECHPKFY